MTSTDFPPPTRRSRRPSATEDAAEPGATLIAEPRPLASTELPVAEALAALSPALPVAPEAGQGKGRVAFGWVDETSIQAASPPPVGLGALAAPAPAAADLLATAPRRSPLRAGVIVPILLIAALFGGYATTTLMWPLHAVAPTVTAMQIDSAAAAAAAPAWPAVGSAGVSVRGIPGSLSSTADPATIASITKIVTALLVLEEMPLSVGEQGPEFRFTWSDSSQYWQYRSRGESALDVPVGGALTEYQMLQGVLIGSANNYADRLASTLWPSDEVFAKAASEWLAVHGVSGVTIVEPTGIDPGNVATNEALLELGVKALANPVIAEIVRTPAVELPGAGLVENTNDLLIDPGMLGIKTGYYDTFNLLSAKDVTVGETTVRIYGSVLGQPDPETRSAATRALYAQVEAELQPRPSVTKGTTAGLVETKWGDSAKVVTTDDAAVILWNGGVAAVAAEYALGDHRAQGDTVGSLTVTGPFDAATVELRLDADIEPPSAWWRLTHPLDLFGLTG